MLSLTLVMRPKSNTPRSGRTSFLTVPQVSLRSAMRVLWVVPLVLMTTSVSASAVPASMHTPPPPRSLKAALLRYPPSRFHELRFGTSFSLKGVSTYAFANKNVGYGLGNSDGFVYPLRTTDSGRVWRTDGPAVDLPPTNTVDFLGGVQAETSSRAVIWSGPSGTPGVFVTSDGGRHWWVLNVGGDLLSASEHGADIWALVVYGGLPSGTALPLVALYETNDEGKLWRFGSTVTDSGGTTADFVRASAKTAFVLLQNFEGEVPTPTAAIYRTTNSGANWTKLPDPCNVSLSGTTVNFTERMEANSASSVWILCGSEPGTGSQVKLVAHSNNGGLKWKIVAHGVPGRNVDNGIPYLGSLARAGSADTFFTTSALDATLLLYGSFPGGPVVTTTDGGRTWTTGLPTKITDQFPKAIWLGRGVSVVQTQNALWRSLSGHSWRLMAGSATKY